jgi:hypothetical protein
MRATLSATGSHCAKLSKFDDPVIRVAGYAADASDPISKHSR